METYGLIKDDLPPMKEQVLDEIKKHPDGITLKETAKLFGVHPNDISGRFTKLFNSGSIRRDGRRYLRNHNGEKRPHFVYKVVG